MENLRTSAQMMPKRFVSNAFDQQTGLKETLHFLATNYLERATRTMTNPLLKQSTLLPAYRSLSQITYHYKVTALTHCVVLGDKH